MVKIDLEEAVMKAKAAKEDGDVQLRQYLEYIVVSQFTEKVNEIYDRSQHKVYVYSNSDNGTYFERLHDRVVESIYLFNPNKSDMFFWNFALIRLEQFERDCIKKSKNYFWAKVRKISMDETFNDYDNNGVDVNDTKQVVVADYRMQDVVDVVEDMELRDNLIRLASDNERKIFIVRNWLDGFFGETEIANMMVESFEDDVDNLSGKQRRSAFNKHRKFIQRFVDDCKKQLLLETA